MTEEFLKINDTDGRSRAFDQDGNLVSIDGEKIAQVPGPAPLAPVIPIATQKKKGGVENADNP